METPYEELDDWDDRPLREWMLQHTRDQGVIDLWEFLSVLECMTDNWYDHSASDNLYVRKMHYAETRMAGYSFWPGQGWDGMFQDLRDAVDRARRRGAHGHAGRAVVIEDGEVKGVDRSGRDKVHAQRDLRGRGARGRLRDLHAAGLERAARRAASGAAGLVRGADPVPRPGRAADLLARPLPGHRRAGPRDRPARARHLAARAAVTGSPGFFFNQTAMDPTTSPAGTNLLRRRRRSSRARRRATSGYAQAAVRALRGRPEDDVPGPARTPTGAAATWSTTRPSASSRSPAWSAASARTGGRRTSRGCTSPPRPSAPRDRRRPRRPRRR